MKEIMEVLNRRLEGRIRYMSPPSCEDRLKETIAQEIEGLKYKMVLDVLKEWADAPFAGDFDQYINRKLSQQED